MKIKHPSLELNWIPKPKDIPMPNIVVESVFNCSAYYVEPESEQHEINGHFYDIDNGLIVINENEVDVIFAGTLAHEYRHHWQYYSGIEIDSIWEIKSDYKSAIIEYFTTYPIEMDALIFEMKLYPEDYKSQWWEWITKHYEHAIQA